MDMEIEYKRKVDIIDHINSMGDNIYNLDIKDFIYHILHLTPQSYGCKIEKFIINKIKGLSINSKLGKGDVLINNKSFEIKSSIITNTNKSLNMVQIRPWQNVDGYIIAYFNVVDDFEYNIIMIPKKEFLSDIYSKNVHSAHGTKTVSEENGLVELRLSLKYDDPLLNKWKESYSIVI